MEYANTSIGPATLPTANMLPMMLFQVGRWLSGTHSARMSVVPACMPAEPIPANDRPKMNTGEFGAVAHTALPVSNISKAARKTYLLEKRLYIFP